MHGTELLSRPPHRRAFSFQDSPIVSIRVGSVIASARGPAVVLEVAGDRLVLAPICSLHMDDETALRHGVRRRGDVIVETIALGGANLGTRFSEVRCGSAFVEGDAGQQLLGQAVDETVKNLRAELRRVAATRAAEADPARWRSTLFGPGASRGRRVGRAGIS